MINTTSTKNLEEIGKNLIENGLELLGFKYERRTEPFRGAVRC